MRAIRILRDEVTTIACEDTRQTHKLLDHFQIRKPLLSYHDHNEASRTAELLILLELGETVALVSDAGTPLISDPGFRLVTAAVAKGITVIPLPGPCAALTALAGSGLPTDEFRFIGFVPQKAGARRRLFESLAGEQATVVAYESPHRILESLADLADALGSRPVVLARELTKLHEEFLRGTARQIHDNLAQRPSIKGEFTLLIGKGETSLDHGVNPAAEVIRLQKDEGLDRMEAIKAVAKRLGLPKREVYRGIAERDSNLPGRRRD